jgi:hypothetical protein
LLYKSSLVWCSSICSLFLLDAEPFEFCLGSHFLHLSVPVFYCFLELFQSFRHYIKIFDPLWVDFGTGWKTGV